MNLLRTRPGCYLVVLMLSFLTGSPTARAAQLPENLQTERLVAWCIVPFDAAKRSPEERAKMLAELGLKRCAYDWREEHVPTFEAEIQAYEKQGIEFFAFWGAHEEAFRLFAKYDLHPQIWQMMAEPPEGEQDARVRAAAASLRPLAERTKQLGCALGIYNHGGWSGEPRNMVAVCRKLRDDGFDHVGIVYNWHHGHEHIKDWPASLALMKPYLLCLNLNGMNANATPKILPLGKGQFELPMLQEVVRQAYTGPIGILDHRETIDSRVALQANLDGLEQLRSQLAPATGAGTRLSPEQQRLVARLQDDAMRLGRIERGAEFFATAKLACLSCHKLGNDGADVGPALTTIGKQRTGKELIASVMWPNLSIEPEYMIHQLVTNDGQIVQGLVVSETLDAVNLRELNSNSQRTYRTTQIQERTTVGSPMPGDLVEQMSYQQQLDLIRFLLALDGTNSAALTAFQSAMDIARSEHHDAHHHHHAAKFELTKEPIRNASWPNSRQSVNRDRVYDFYTKQAEAFRRLAVPPMLLASFPGLDGGHYGHWGNQDEATWADGSWNATDLGTVQCGVFHAPGVTVPRAVCVRLGGPKDVSACFNPDTLEYDAVWTGGFLEFSDVRHGFLHGLQMDGKSTYASASSPPDQDFSYHGFYRDGAQVVFAYRIGDTEYLDAPTLVDGHFQRDRRPRDEHPLRTLLSGGTPQWPQTLTTRIRRGSDQPYAIDTIELPFDNPWQSLMFVGDHAFLADGTAMVCTMQGDVWHVSGLDSDSNDQDGTAIWRRFAAGLHQALGMVVSGHDVFVLGRDQVTRLHDTNDDGEADFYECFSRAFVTSPAGHDFICGLERDEDGAFYTASGSQGLLKISADGQNVTVLATGLRNPDGLGLLPDGTLTVPASEGDWTPSSMIAMVDASERADRTGGVPTHFGYGGPVDGAVPALPLAYLPRGLDNSSGGQTVVASERWGPLAGQLLHFSFGTGSHFLVLRDGVNGQQQGAVVPLTGDFASGVHRGRFRAQDGQLYVSGMAGWGTYTPSIGCFQRVRYTGAPVQVPVGFHVHENGVVVEFSSPLDCDVAEDIHSHFAQCWNYRYSQTYGSPELATSHPGTAGHDSLLLVAAHVLEGGKRLFLEIPDLQPVSQLHLRLHVNRSDSEWLTPNPSGSGHDLFVTVHELDKPFTEFANYVARKKVIAAHPLLRDLASQTEAPPNPWHTPIKNARQLRIETGKNLTYTTQEFTTKAGEPIALTLVNPDVVPHNWVLARPGCLAKVGKLANQLISDPMAATRQYIPVSDDVLCHTDIVSPKSEFTIFFYAPENPGRYPYLCTFPGHWMVMNGMMVVTE